METYSALFLSAINQYIAHGCTGAYIANFFKNMFDNDAQEKYKTYLNGLRDYCELSVQKDYQLIKKTIETETDRFIHEAILSEITNDAGKPAKTTIISKETGKMTADIVCHIADRCADAVRILRFMTEAPGKG